MRKLVKTALAVLVMVASVASAWAAIDSTGLEPWACYEFNGSSTNTGSGGRSWNANSVFDSYTVGVTGVENTAVLPNAWTATPGNVSTVGGLTVSLLATEGTQRSTADRNGHIFSLAAKGDAGAPQWWLRNTETVGQVKLQGLFTEDLTITLPSEGTEGTFHHYVIAISGDRSVATVYVDGVPVNTAGMTVNKTDSGMGANDAFFGYQIGGRWGGGDGSGCAVDDLRLYTATLTPGQVAALYGAFYANDTAYTRTLSGEIANWKEADAWAIEEATAEIPAPGAQATLTAERDTTLTLNGMAALSRLTIEGDGAVTMAGDAQWGIGSTETVINSSADFSGVSAGLGAVTIAQDKTLTVGATPSLSIANGANAGTLKVVGGSEEAPIVLSAGTVVNADIGQVELAESTALRLHATGGNKVYKVRGAGASSVLLLTSGQNWGLTETGTMLENLTLVVPAMVDETTENKNFWMTPGKMDSTVHFRTEKQITGENVNGGTFDFASIAGAGNFVGGGRHIRISDGADAVYSGVFSGGGSFEKSGVGTQTLSGANTYTGGTRVLGGTLRLEGAGTLGTGIVAVSGGAKVTFAGTGTLANAFSGAGAIEKTGEGTTSLTGNLSGFTGAVTVAAGTLDVSSATVDETASIFGFGEGSIGTLVFSAGKEGTLSVPAGATLKLRLSLMQQSSGYTATHVTLEGEGETKGKLVFLDTNDEPITEGVDGTTYTAQLNTWTPTVEEEIGVYAWDNAENWSKGALPAAADTVRVSLSEDATLTLHEAATVENLIVEGTGTLTLAGQKLTISGELVCGANVQGVIENLSSMRIRIDQDKVLTLSSETVVEDPDGFGAGHVITLPELTGLGQLVKTGSGAVVLWARSAEPSIIVNEGALHVRAVPSTRLDVTASRGADIRLTAWNTSFNNNLNRFNLEGGSKFVLANGPNTTINGVVVVSKAEEEPVKIYGSSFGTVSLATDFTLAEGAVSGKVEFAEGEAFGAGASATKYPCNNEVRVTGSLSGALSVRISDQPNAVTFSGANTYTGGTTIAEGATLSIANVAALGSGTIAGSGTLRSTAGIPENRNGLGDSAWMGRLVIASNITFADTDDAFGACGNAASTIELAGTNAGYLKSAGSCTANLVLSGSLTLNNGYSSNGGYTFSGALSGEGTLATSGTPTDVIQFTGDVSGFAGTITVNGGHCVTFGTQADDDTMTGRLVVASGVSVAVPTGKTWSATNGVTVKGTLGGMGTIGSALSFGAGATLDAMAGGALTVNGELSYGGALTVRLPEGFTATAEGTKVLTKTGATAPTGTVTLMVGESEITDAFLEAREDGLYVTRPTITPPTEGEPLSEEVAEILTVAAAQAHVRELTIAEDCSALDGAALFTNVVSVTPSAEGSTQGTATVAYDFGIQSLTIRELTVNGNTALYVVLAAKVQGAEGVAYAGDTEVKVYRVERTTSEMDDATETLTVIDGQVPAEALLGVQPEANVKWLCFPYANLDTTGTFYFKVKATKAATP